MVAIENRIKYGLTKEANLAIIFLKKWLRDNDIEIYSIHNEGESVVPKRFIRTLKTKIYKYMTSISKSVYIDKLDDILNRYKNTYHRTIKIKPVDVKDNTYIDSMKHALVKKLIIKFLDLKLVIM